MTSLEKLSRALPEDLLERLEVSLFPEDTHPSHRSVEHVVRISPAGESQSSWHNQKLPLRLRAVNTKRTPDPFILSLFADDAQREEMAAKYRAGGFGYGEVKKALADLAEGFFAEAWERRRQLEADPPKVRQILGDGAAKARRKAAEVLLRAQQACGVKSC